MRTCRLFQQPHFPHEWGRSLLNIFLLRPTNFVERILSFLLARVTGEIRERVYREQSLFAD